MGNSKKGAIEFSAGGETYSLAFTTNAMVRYQDDSGESLLTGLTALQSDPTDIRRVRGMMRAALAGDVSHDEAGDIMDEVGLMRSITLLSDAATAAFPEADAGAEKGNGQPAKTSRNMKSPNKT
jgi:hypothetical protein